MVENMKSKFLPKDYHLTLHKQMQNLKQKIMTVRDYTEEFCKVNVMQPAHKIEERDRSTT